jgi:hypothetical protein
MACRKINNEKKNIKSPIRLNIVSCSSAHFSSNMSICYRNISAMKIPFPISTHFQKPFVFSSAITGDFFNSSCSLLMTG